MINHDNGSPFLPLDTDLSPLRKESGCRCHSVCGDSLALSLSSPSVLEIFLCTINVSVNGKHFSPLDG